MSDENNLHDSKPLQTDDNRASISQANNSIDNGTESPNACRSPIALQYDVDKPIEIALLVPQHSDEEQLGELRPSMGSDDSIGTVSPLQQSCKNNDDGDYWVRELQRELNKLADAEKQVTDVHYTPSTVIMGSRRNKRPVDDVIDRSPSACNHSRPRARYRLILSDNSLAKRQQSGDSTIKKQQEILMKIEVKPRTNTTSSSFGGKGKPVARHQQTQTEMRPKAVRCTQTVETSLGEKTLMRPVYGQQRPAVQKRAGLQRWGSLQETFATAYPKPRATTERTDLPYAKAPSPYSQVVSPQRSVRRLSKAPYSTCYDGIYCQGVTGEICNCIGGGKLLGRADNVRETTIDAYLSDDHYYTECLRTQEEERSLPLIQLSAGHEPYNDSSFLYLNGNFTSEVSDMFSVPQFYKHYKL